MGVTDSLVAILLAVTVAVALIIGIVFSDHPRVKAVLLGIDQLSTHVGQFFAWTILLLTGVVVYGVTARYVFRAPTTWGYDVSYMLYGTLFMMAGAYALSRNGHVRGDFIYRLSDVQELEQILLEEAERKRAESRQAGDLDEP